MHTKNPLIGKVFVQKGANYQVGCSSYHFESESNVFINFEKWGWGDFFPSTRQFTNTRFDVENRVFIGLIDWTDAADGFNGAKYWLYMMVFDEWFATIEKGYVVDDNGRKPTTFSENLSYVDLAFVGNVDEDEDVVEDVDVEDYVVEPADSSNASEKGNWEKSLRDGVVGIRNSIKSFKSGIDKYGAEIAELSDIYENKADDLLKKKIQDGSFQEKFAASKVLRDRL